jgi:hypothetical protein
VLSNKEHKTKKVRYPMNAPSRRLVKLSPVRLVCLVSAIGQPLSIRKQVKTCPEDKKV